MQITPTPAYNKIFINLDETNWGEFRLVVINMQGAIAMEISNININGSNIEVDITSLSSGTYLLQLISSRDVFQSNFVNIEQY
jgi:hypothetical protein